MDKITPSVFPEIPLHDEYGEFSNIELAAAVPMEASTALCAVGWGYEPEEICDFILEETTLKTPVRIFYPEGDGPFPFFLYIHGGGFIGGNAVLDETFNRTVCCRSRCAIVAPTYVIAPQHPYPEALNELYEMVCYLINHAANFRLSAEKWAIGGGSAGGNLALALCQKGYETGTYRVPYALVNYPCLRLEEPGEEKITDLTYVPGMPPAALEHMYDHYLLHDEDRTDPKISPYYMALQAIPPICIFTGCQDTLHKESLDFAWKLMCAGKEVLLKTYANTRHGFNEGDGMENQATDNRFLIAAQLEYWLRGDESEF